MREQHNLAAIEQAELEAFRAEAEAVLGQSTKPTPPTSLRDGMSLPYCHTCGQGKQGTLAPDQQP
jgi:hypothetical protein